MKPVRTKTTVLLLDGECKAAPAIVRALGEAGYRLVVAAVEDQAPAQRSRFARARALHPHPGGQPDAFADWVETAINGFHPDCVLPVTECSIQSLHPRRTRLAQRSAVLLPPAEAMSIAFDKSKLLSLAHSLGISSPMTYQPASLAEADALSEKLCYPVYIKARRSYDGTPGAQFARGRCAHHAADCRQVYRDLHSAVALPIIQDAVPGPVVAVCGTWDQGHPVCRFCYVAQSAWPISGGQSVWRRSIDAAEAPIEQTDRLLHALAWTGPAHAQFIHDRRDGSFRLLEINGRFWGSLDAAHFCGVPVAVTAVQVAMGLSPAPDLRYRTGVESRSLEGDLKRTYAVAIQREKWLAQSLEVPPLSSCLKDLVRGFGPAVHQDDFYLDDPMPGIAVMARAIRRAIDHIDESPVPAPLPMPWYVGQRGQPVAKGA